MSFKSDATYYFHITKCPSLFTRVFGFDSEKLSKWQFFGVKTSFHFVFKRGWSERKFERGWSGWSGWSESYVTFVTNVTNVTYVTNVKQEMAIGGDATRHSCAPLQKSNNFERFFGDSTLTFLTSENTFRLPILPTRRIIFLCLPLI